MFEKEAEEYLFDRLDPKAIDSVSEFSNKYIEEAIVSSFKDGIEFGYNKAKVEVEESYREFLCNSELNLASVTEQLEELEKANEWHYPSKGELPENNKLCLIQMKTGTFEIAYRVTDLCWKYKNTTFSCSFQSAIYAWKEIVLPKESE